MRYQAERVPLVIFAGQEYGTGSSRDWAAKGTRLLGVRAVVAQSFERIHRSNLVGMGVLPLQFPDGVSAASLGIGGSETFDLLGVGGTLRPRQEIALTIRRADGSETQTPLRLRIDTPIEVEYYRHGGILPFVLRQLLARWPSRLAFAAGARAFDLGDRLDDDPLDAPIGLHRFERRQRGPRGRTDVAERVGVLPQRQRVLSLHLAGRDQRRNGRGGLRADGPDRLRRGRAT